MNVTLQKSEKNKKNTRRFSIRLYTFRVKITVFPPSPPSYITNLLVNKSYIIREVEKKNKKNRSDQIDRLF